MAKVKAFVRSAEKIKAELEKPCEECGLPMEGHWEKTDLLISGDHGGCYETCHSPECYQLVWLGCAEVMRRAGILPINGGIFDRESAAIFPRRGKMDKLRHQLVQWARYNLLTFPVVMAFYVPYNIFFIGYTPFQLAKWIVTSAFYGGVFNVFMRPWLSFLYRRRWLK